MHAFEQLKPHSSDGNASKHHCKSTHACQDPVGCSHNYSELLSGRYLEILTVTPGLPRVAGNGRRWMGVTLTWPAPLPKVRQMDEHGSHGWHACSVDTRCLRQSHTPEIS
jgi:hypothetical protein